MTFANESYRLPFISQSVSVSQPVSQSVSFFVLSTVLCKSMPSYIDPILCLCLSYAYNIHLLTETHLLKIKLQFDV